MHIQERNNTTLTQCSKMTEEVGRRHGINGNSSKGVSDESPTQSSASPSGGSAAGGRLKFFKDGKCILELERRAPDGERMGWVSVPRKIFWPPTSSGPPPAPTTPSTPSTTGARQDRATSLSVSDDNSSIQSSPWQRDHYWKQTTPRRGISREMSMLYIRPTCLPSRLLRCPPARAKRRRPLDPAPVLPDQTNGSSSPDHDNQYRNFDKATASGKFKFFKNKCESVPEPIVLRVYKKTKKRIKRRELCDIVKTLKEKLMNLAPANTKFTNCKQDHFMVSPRKRILREHEKNSLEDSANKKSRARQASSNPQPGPSYAPHHSPKLYNGTSHPKPTPPSKPVSSYSIHSILSNDSTPSKSPEYHSVKKPHSHPAKSEMSPGSVSSQIYSRIESPVGVHSPELNTANKRYVTMESPVGSHSPDSVSLKKSHYSYVKTESPVSIHSPVPSPSPEQYRRPRLPYQQPMPYVPEMGEYYPDNYRVEDLAYRLIIPGNPYLGAFPSYRPPMMLMQYPPVIPPRAWPPTEHVTREDASSDLPLNLSKH